MNAHDSLFAPFETRNFISYRLANLQNKLNAQAGRILSKHCDLTLTEWRVLLLISVWDKNSMATITRDAEMDKGQVSRAVKSLTSKGYLKTEDDQNDGRALILAVTDTGLAVKDKVLPRMAARQDRLMKSVSEPDRLAMERVLDALEDASRIDDF